MNRNRYNSLASADSNASELHDIWEEFSCNGRDCDLEDMMPTPSPLPSRRVGHHYNGCCFIRLFFRGGIFPSSFFSSYIRGCLVAGQSPWVRAWTAAYILYAPLCLWHKNAAAAAIRGWGNDCCL